MPGDRDPHASIATATRPCSSRSAPCKEKSLTKAELGHLKKADASAHRHLRRVPRRGRRAAGRRDRDGRGVLARRPGRRSPGMSKGKGFQGTIKRHNFASGPEVPRLAQRPRAGIDRRLGDPVARVQGHPRPGPDGRRPRHPARADRGRGDPDAEPAARPRRRARPAAAEPWRCGPMARNGAPMLGGGTVDARRGRVRGALQHAARARDRARGAERAPPGHRLDARPAARSPAAAPSRGARRAPAAPAPAPRARRCGPAAASCSARRRATTRSRSTARRAARRCAARSRCTPSASRWRCSTPPRSTSPRPRRPSELLG